MKTSWNLKQSIISILIIFAIVAALFVIDEAHGVYSQTNDNQLKVYVTDLNNKPVQNATVVIHESNARFFTDNKGYTPTMEVKRLVSDEKNWFTVTVTVEAKGYVDTVLFDCVIYDKAQRVVQIRLYADDQSGLPFVAYTEIPPSNYIYSLFDD